jgi:tetraacyldisaccharide-1-P 4'-kinase
VADLKAEVLGHSVFADHAAPPVAAWSAAAKRARAAGAELLLATGKDAPKIPDGDFGLAIDALEVVVALIDGDATFDALSSTALNEASVR